MRATQDHDVAGATAHFLNCFLGHDVVPETEKASDSSASKAPVKAAITEKARKKGKGGRKSVENSSTVPVS